jgi:hypothetical protein
MMVKSVVSNLYLIVEGLEDRGAKIETKLERIRRL